MTIPNDKLVLGIDLGTTCSMACILRPEDKKPVIIKPDPNWSDPMLPSVYCKTKDRGPLVGHPAVQCLKEREYSEYVVRFAKRYMDDPHKTFECYDKTQVTPTEVSARFLGTFRERAEKQLGIDPYGIANAVITVPAYFGFLARQQTREAGKQAGFTKVHLMDEPVAAAFGLGLHEERDEKLVLVVDLGGGTLDVTLLRVGKAVKRWDENSGAISSGFDEIARDGENALGGLNWDEAIARIALVKAEPEVDEQLFAELLKCRDPMLYEGSETAKLTLCNFQDTHDVQVSFQNPHNGRTHRGIVSRAEFLEETDYLADACAMICDRLLCEIPKRELEFFHRKRRNWFKWCRFRSSSCEEITWDDIDRVYMVGGGSHVPMVRQKLRERWRPKTTDSIELLAPEPQRQVAYGAAQAAAYLADEKTKYIFRELPLRSAHTIGILHYPNGSQEEDIFEPLIKRNVRVPARYIKRFEVDNPTGSRFEGTFIEKERTLDFKTPETFKESLEDSVKNHTLGKIVILDVPSRGKNDDNVVTVTLDYRNSEIKIEAKLRGKSGTFAP